jgi:caffeoyl-CoA O-methyltransferase
VLSLPPGSFQLVPAVKPDVIDVRVATYATQHSTQPDAVQQALIDETAAMGRVSMLQIGGDQGVLLEMLARATGARRAIEIGTFTGYSALAIARGMGPGGRLLCCDVNEEWTAVARRAWAAAGLDDQIELRLAPALDTIAALGADDRFDLAFIDADKTNYLNYYEALLPRMRTGGLVLVDNTLWRAQVLDASDTSADTVAIRAFNDHVAADERVHVVLLTISDGLTVIEKR